MGRRHLRPVPRRGRRAGPWPGRGGHPAWPRVGLMSRTRYEWTLIDYAIWSVGAVTVPVYETSSAEQVRWMLEDSGAVAAVRRDRRARAAGRRRPRLTCRPHRGVAHRQRGPRPAPRAGRDGRRGRHRRAAAHLDRQRCRHDHLHQRHDRPAQGLRADPPQPALRHHQRGAGAARPVPRGRLDTALPSAGPLVRPADPDRHGAGPRHDGAPGRHQDAGRRPQVVPADVPALGAAGVREGAHRRPSSGPRPTARAASSPRPSRWRSPYSTALEGRRPRASACGCSTPSTTSWSTASCGPRSAAMHTGRSPAAPRSAPGSRTSSAASASPSTRATASPRPRPRSRSTWRAPPGSAPSAGRCPA